MGSKKRAGSAGKAPKVEVDPEVAAKSRETKGEGDKLFVKKEWAKAIEAYASAAALLPEGAGERADILCAKAACLYAQRRWRDSARECSAALASAPSASASPAGAKALLRRAHCYEHLELYKQALSDAQAYNRTELASDDSKRLEQRLRVALQGGGGGANGSASAAAAAARGPSLAVNRGAASGGAAGRAAAAAAAYQQAQAQAQAQAQQQRPPTISYVAAKITLAGEDGAAANGADGADARAVYMPANAASYAMLRAGAAEKFAAQLAPEGTPVPFVLRYSDGAGGGPTTITCRQDVAQAAAAALLRDPAAAKNSGAAGYVLPFEVTAVRVPDAAQVPPVPEDEEEQRRLHERYTRVAMAKMQKAQQEAKAQLDQEEQAQQQQQQQQEAEAAAAAGGAGHVDEWLLEFADVFREMSQIDADAHLDATNEGYDHMGRAMAATLRCDAALPLFGKAQDKFAEATALCLINWGNVHQAVAQKHVADAAPAASEAARTPGVADTNEARAKAAQKAALAAAAKKAGAELDLAEKRLQDALKYRPDFFDALAALGNLEFERAKLRAGLAVVSTDGIGKAKQEEGEGGGEGEEGKTAAANEANGAAAEEGGEEGKTGAAEVTPAAAEALREALRRVGPGDVSAAKKHYDAAAKWFDKARLAGAAVDARHVADAEAARLREGASEGGAAAAAAEEAGAQQLSPEMSSECQALIMSGNVAYEWSQLLSAVAGDAGGGGGGKAASDAAGKAWRAALDDATARFREAKCSEADVRAALKNHTRAADLDIGPDPEEEAEADAPEAEAEAAAAPAAPAAADAAPAPAPKERPAPKGLPSLDLKGGKKKAAAAAAESPKA